MRMTMNASGSTVGRWLAFGILPAGWWFLVGMGVGDGQSDARAALGPIVCFVAAAVVCRGERRSWAEAAWWGVIGVVAYVAWFTVIAAISATA